MGAFPAATFLHDSGLCHHPCTTPSIRPPASALPASCVGGGGGLQPEHYVLDSCQAAQVVCAKAARSRHARQPHCHVRGCRTTADRRRVGNAAGQLASRAMERRHCELLVDMAFTVSRLATCGKLSAAWHEAAGRPMLPEMIPHDMAAPRKIKTTPRTTHGSGPVALSPSSACVAFLPLRTPAAAFSIYTCVFIYTTGWNRPDCHARGVGKGCADDQTRGDAPLDHVDLAVAMVDCTAGCPVRLRANRPSRTTQMSEQPRQTGRAQRRGCHNPSAPATSTKHLPVVLVWSGLVWGWRGGWEPPKPCRAKRGCSGHDKTTPKPEWGLRLQTTPLQGARARHRSGAV
jgi:hypothetical protein